MPIASGAKGSMSVLASPKGGWTPRSDGTGGPRGISGGAPLGGFVPPSGLRTPVTFRSAPLQAVGKLIAGVTRDATGAALGGVTVDLYDTRTRQFVATTVSDGNGDYSFGVGGGGGYFEVAYLTGAPDRAATTKQDLVGS